VTKGDYESNVFVNCPFDEEYRHLFQALVFTIHECGFIARCALEGTDASELRVKKIYELIRASKYGVHDLSRVTLDANTNLPRFNMPLELGIFLGAKFLGTSRQKLKNCLVFDEQPYRYQMYLSDIAGQDICSHQNDVSKLISHVRNWLSTEATDALPGGRALWVRFNRFLAELVGMCQSDHQAIEELPFPDFVRHVGEFTRHKSDVMKTGLKTRWGQRLADPPLTHIREAIKQLNGKTDSFVILSKSGTGRSYMQVHGGKNVGYTLEYQDGSPSSHHRCTSDLSETQLINVFQQFRSGSDEWRESLRWEQHSWWAAEHG